MGSLQKLARSLPTSQQLPLPLSSLHVTSVQYVDILLYKSQSGVQPLYKGLESLSGLYILSKGLESMPGLYIRVCSLYLAFIQGSGGHVYCIQGSGVHVCPLYKGLESLSGLHILSKGLESMSGLYIRVCSPYTAFI